jgi:cobaltochelatase CobN
MHILTTTSASLDDVIEPVDLRQTPGEVVALSFTDSDLAALASAWKAEADRLPSMRLAALRDLRHPMSVDLWVDSVASHAKVILVRLLGGYDWWRYGCDQLAAIARAKGIRLALLPGECRDEDERLAQASTLPREELSLLLGYFREGGPANMQALVRRLANLAGHEAEGPAPEPVPRAGYYEPGSGVVETPQIADESAAPAVPILFYRSMLLANDVAPIDALTAELRLTGIAAVPIFVSSLKDAASLGFVEQAIAALQPTAIFTATAFASGAEPGAETLFDRTGIPVFQVIVATTKREAWQNGQRGPRHARCAARTRRAHHGGRDLLQGGGGCRCRTRPARQRQPAGARPRRAGGAAAFRFPAAARHAASRTARRHPHPGLSERARPHRICGGSRCAEQRARHAA